MTWNDDSWRDSYDDWKLQSPYDEYDEPECDHDDHDIDILTGRAECNMCPHSWYPGAEAIDLEMRRQATYYDDMERENRRQWWRDLFEPILGPIRRLKMYIYEWRVGRDFEHSVGDDEIPF